MSTHAILFPLCAQAFLTFVVWFWMYYIRIGIIYKKRIHVQKMDDVEFFDREFKVGVNTSDNLENLFEMPLLFFAVGLVIHTAGITDAFNVMLAFLYVALRGIHSFIHCSYNWVIHRFIAYAASSLILMWLWVRTFIQIAALS